LQNFAKLSLPFMLHCKIAKKKKENTNANLVQLNTTWASDSTGLL
jgi:hypothetical protein